MAINNTTVVPQIIAAAFLVEYRKNRVFTDRTNNTWRSALRSAGDTVIVNTPGSASAITDYTANSTVSYADADVGTPITLTIDRVKAWSIKFDDLNAAKSSLPVLRQQVTEQAQELANVVDRDVKAAMDDTNNASPGSNTAGAGYGPDISIDYTEKGASANDAIRLENFKLNAYHRILDLADVPLNGRWAIVGPYTAELIRTIAAANDRILAGPRDSIGNRLLNNGVMGDFQGFTWYVSNQIGSLFGANARVQPTANTRGNPAVTAGNAWEPIYVGNDSATAFVDQISRTEQIRLQTTFADAVRGLYSYGAKVIRQNRVLRGNVAIANVPS